MKFKKPIIIIAIIAVIIVAFIDKLYLPDPIKLTYIGEVNGWIDETYWYCVTKEIALRDGHIESGSEVYEKVKQIDGSKYQLILSIGLPLKKLSVEPESHIGIAEYDESKAKAKKVYIYIIDKNIRVWTLDA